MRENYRGGDGVYGDDDDYLSCLLGLVYGVCNCFICLLQLLATPQRGRLVDAINRSQGQR